MDNTDTTSICSSKVCSSEFSKSCLPVKQENIATCTSDSLCIANGQCKTIKDSEIYKTCIGTPSETTWTIPNQKKECICFNRFRDSAAMDIYFWNNTSNILSMVGQDEPIGNDGQASVGWILWGDSFNNCATARWLIPPPLRVLPGETFLARVGTYLIRDESKCKRDTLFNVCLTYGIDGKEDNSVTISMCRTRPGSGSNYCHHFGPVSGTDSSVKGSTCQHSCARGNLSLTTNNLKSNGKPTPGSYQFIVTGGSGNVKCNQNPDSCPAGMYCTPESICISGCKTNPDSCLPSQICDPNSRTCKTPTSCTKNTECPLTQYCLNDFCANGCTLTSNNCGTNMKCQDGVCVSDMTPSGPSGPSGPGKKKLSTETIILIVMVVIIVVIFIIGFFIYFRQPKSKVTPG